MAIQERNPDLDNASDYVFDSIILLSERLSSDIDIKDVVTDLEVYENINLPYLTAYMTIVDNSNLISSVDILGGEKIQVTLRSLVKLSRPTTKTFYISKVKKSQKVDDHTEVNHFHLIEDICYISNLQNVNKFYSGEGFTLIKNISKNFLSREVVNLSDDTSQSSINVIVPNLEPLESMMWIRNQMKTTEGYPFYLFSTLFGKNLALIDLGKMIQIQPVNNIPYTGYQSASNSLEPGVSGKVINEFRFEESEDLYTLIKKGFIGAKYNYLRTLSASENNFKFDVVKDLLKPLIEKNILNEKQKNPTFTPAYKLDEVSFNEIQSKTITRIGGSGAFRSDTTFTDKLSYNEELTIGDFKRNVISNAMDSIIKKSPLTIAVDGLDFIQGNQHLTIGNNIQVEFLSTLIDGRQNRIDKKRSGTYLMHSAKHLFKKEKYDLVMTGVKMGNLSESSARA